MRILTVREFFFTQPIVNGKPVEHGPKDRKERTIAFATDYGLPAALRRLKAYERAYRERFALVDAIVEFGLLSVSEQPGLSAHTHREVLGGAKVLLIEDLAQTPEDFK